MIQKDKEQPNPLLSMIVDVNAEANVIALAQIHAGYYKSLLKDNIGSEIALTMTIAFITSMAARGT